MSFARITNACSQTAGNFVRSGVVLLLLGVAACQPIQAPSAPTAQVIQVTFTPAVSTWKTPFNRCAGSLPGIGLEVDERYAGQLDPGTAGLVVRAGPPPGAGPATAVIIGWDDLVFITHAGSLTASLSLNQIARLYTGQVHAWRDLVPGGSPDTPVSWTYPSGDELRGILAHTLGLQNSITVGAYVAPDPAAMLDAVSQTPGAIGYLLKSALPSAPAQVQVLALSGDGLSQLHIPITTSHNDQSSQPEGMLRQLMLCVQAQPGP